MWDPEIPTTILIRALLLHYALDAYKWYSYMEYSTKQSLWTVWHMHSFHTDLV